MINNDVNEIWLVECCVFHENFIFGFGEKFNDDKKKHIFWAAIPISLKMSFQKTQFSCQLNDSVSLISLFLTLF